MNVKPYDPLTYENLMAGLMTHFDGTSKQPLSALDDTDVQGAGIYALFYSGEFDSYRPAADGSTPLYVGKALPAGSRKGSDGNNDAGALRRRLREHRKSLDQAQNLEVSDFQFRILAVVNVWITLAEQFLINGYRPVWNKSLDGFGKHNSGSARKEGKKSWWDTLHPGREWAAREREVYQPVLAQKMVEKFFKEQQEG